MAAKGFTSVLVAFALLGGCSTSETPSGSNSQATGSSQSDFVGEIEALCDSLTETTDTLNAADSRAEFDRLSQDLLAEQRDFVGRAEELTPPSDVADAFDEYLAGIDDFVDLNERSLASNDHVEGLQLALEASENGVDLLEAKRSAELPDSCPPGSAEEVYGFLFQARANGGCYDLSAELSQLGRLQAKADTRKGTAKLVRFMYALAWAHADIISEAIPPQLDNADVDRMAHLYFARAKAIGRMNSAWRTENEADFKEAAREQQQLLARADRLARAFGLDECVNFIGVATT